MPVYDEQTFKYEILLRFGDVAPYKGLLRGASRTTITQTTKDGVPIATNINPPEQLALVAGEEGDLLSDVLGEVATETIVLNGQLQNALADRNAISAQQLESLTQAQEQITQLTANNEQLAQEYQTQIAALNSQVLSLEVHVADLQAQLDAVALQAAPDDPAEDAAQA